MDGGVDAVCRVSAAWRGCYGLKCESASVRKLIDFLYIVEGIM